MYINIQENPWFTILMMIELKKITILRNNHFKKAKEKTLSPYKRLFMLKLQINDPLPDLTLL